jgi:hypothetical protein
MLHLRVEEATADPQAMTNDLRAAGVDARVEVAPVGPSFIGQWIMMFEEEPDGGDADSRNPFVSEQLPTRVLQLPSDYSNPLTLTVGRKAEEGETWDLVTASDAMDDIGPGGAMCHFNLTKKTPVEAERALVEQGYEVEWRMEAPNSFERISGAPTDAVIIYAFLLGPDTIRISAAEAGTNFAERALEIQERAGC